MNKSGFTLIELVATLLLLSVISLISYVSIFNMIKDSNDKECENIKITLTNAAKSYISDNRYSNNTWGSSLEITAKTLVDNNYITGEITNPYTKEVINSNTIRIIIDLDSNYTPKKIQVAGLPNDCQS